MNRIKVVGLCVVVACALGAVAGVSLAATAEFGQCVSVKITGNYTNTTCTTVAEKGGVPDHKGGFEFESAGSCYGTTGGNFTESECKTVAEKRGKPDHKGGFESAPSPTLTTNSGPAEWMIAGFGSFKCSASSGVGTIAGAMSVTEQVTFTGCEESGQKCQNTATEGEIVTFPLTGNLTEPTLGKAELVLSGVREDGGYFVDYACTGVSFIRTGGSVGDNITPVNTQGTTTSFNFESGVEQHLETEFSSTPTFEAGTVLGPFATELLGSSTVVGSPAEIVHVN